jgi:TonB family protein
MSAAWWLGNLVSYSVQVALVVLAGGLAAAMLRLKQPRVMLAYWQALLAACLLLPLLEPWHQTLLAPAGGAARSFSSKASGAVSHLDLFPLYAWVLLVLLAGVGLGLLRLALGLWRLNHYRRTALPIVPLPGTLRDAQALVGVEPAVYFSDHLGVPVTFGWLRPAIIFPSRFGRMDESHQRAIACHELLHVARYDWPVNLFEEFALTLFWFHPGVWWVMRNIRLSREQVVDCEVVALTGARRPYLHALLEMAGATRAKPVPAPLFLVESQLAQRIASLVKEVRMSKPRLVMSLVIALGIVMVAGWWAIRTFYLRARAGNPPAIVSATAMKYDIGEVYTVGGDVSSPIPIYKPEPGYTEEARAAKLQGSNVFWMVVDGAGKVADVRLVKSVGKGLDESAAETLRTWKFKPALRKGKPVPIRVIVEVNFRMY